MQIRSEQRSQRAEAKTASVANAQKSLNDNRSSAIVQRQLAEMITGSPRMASQRKQMTLMSRSPSQRRAVDKDRTIQEKSLTVQRADEPEEETLFQKKTDPVQKADDDEAPLEEDILQGKFDGSADMFMVQRQKDSSSEASHAGLPNTLKAGIESLSGMAMNDVKVHYNSDKPAQLQALAYAQGNDIHVGPGQERHLPHEAWHVVQQRQGRVRTTMQTKGAAINDDPGLEAEADAMGARALQLETIQRKLGSRQLNSVALPVSSPSSTAVQRVFAYENPVESDENTIEELRGTTAGETLVSQIAAHEKTCTVHWAASRREEMYAQPTNAEAARDPLRGSNVRVNIPMTEGDAGDKYQHMLVDGGGDNKMPATVVALHELVHAYAAMRGMMEGMENDVVHSVLQGDTLIRKEVIPLEEILTMGLRDSDTYTHQFHNLRTGADISATVRDKMAARGVTENTLRDEQDVGVRSAYVSNPNVIPPTDRDTFLDSARARIKEALDEIAASVIGVRGFVQLLVPKRGTLSATWQRHLDAAPGFIDGWRQQIAAREAVSMQPLTANLATQSHADWETGVKAEVSYLNGRNAVFRERIWKKWQKKYMDNR